MPYRKPARKTSLSKRLVMGVVLLLLVCLVAILELTNVTHIFHKKTVVVVSGSSFNTKGEPKSTKPVTQNGSASGVSNNTGSKSTGSSLALVAPSGDFISNHHPNLSGSPAPNTMSSVCNSSPGASCQIIFTQDGVVKSLPVKTTDSNGTAYWNWQLQDIGLTSGSWSIQASASLSGQTKTASDVMDLVVSQ